MIRRKDLKGFRARYHRNGVGGEGFTLCEFKFLGCDMRAVVFEGSGQVACIAPHDIRMCFRGDDFEPAVREQLEAIERERATGV